MKLNNLQKNFFIFFSVIISILIISITWDKINLPINNASETEGYNATNDTIRYVVFISIPLIIFLFLNQALTKRTIKIKELIFEKDEKIKNNHSILITISFLFIIFIFLEFFSINFIYNYRLDHMHDGAYLMPAQNYLSSKKFWAASYLTHGGSDVFYPLLAWKILGVQTIGAARTLNIFLILILKLLCILLSYQFTKITNLNRETKILFFTVFTAVLISMSKYAFLGENYYFHHRDIFTILFVVLLIELFTYSKIRTLLTILLSLTATVSVLLHIDIGVYINFILFFYCLYLLFAKKYNEIILIFHSLIICWAIVISIIGFEEFKAFLENIIAAALAMDSSHGLKYPEPFFSIGENQDGTRATRGLLLQLTAGLFVLNSLFSNQKKIFSSKKMLFIFIFLFSFVMYRSGLGRSDAPHIRAVNDLPILINMFFILNYLLIFIKEKFTFKKFSPYKLFLSLSVVFLIFYNIVNHNKYSFKNIINYKNNFIYFINLEDRVFLHPKTIQLIDYYKLISKKDACVENITFDDSIPYLLKKPSCTKYWASWLVNDDMQRDYVDRLKKIQPKYIIYSSVDIRFDGRGLYERIKIVNSYILSNYKKYHELDDYIILEKK